MNLYWLVCSLLRLANGFINAQSIDHYHHYTIKDAELGSINYHLQSQNSNQLKPLLLWLDGSGCQPIQTVIDDGKNCCYYLSPLMIDIDSLARFYHVVNISKPGVAFADTVRVATLENFDLLKYHEAHFSGPICGKAYTSKISLGWRAKAASRVIDDVVKRVAVDSKRILVAGHSEGAPVAAKTATLNAKVTHVACFAGPGLTQFYDFILDARKKVLTGELSPEAGQAKIDTLLTVYQKIYRSPSSTTQFWEGETYQRWTSFSESMGENLLKLTIPVYVAIGTHDANTMGENADIIPVLFAQRQKSNLTYRACAHCDHWFTDTRNGRKHFLDYLGEFLKKAQ